MSEEHGQRMACRQAQDGATLAAFRAAADDPEFTVDAGKANTLEDGWKDLKMAGLQKRRAGKPTTVTQWDWQRLPEGTGVCV